eukprot:NODE_161_length_2951_cov_24.948656_g148_i0.p1 GENE.NODE_161_length_2951_cov_24.948656_g148_i0~~NODE_161_length_2951_cov_24.948656_g148_i0.p1  ORF type:complete len:700 (-),score=108.00 NODE_161_length_2951_cov_24.948656_g148_i0:75-2174(-)
MQQGCHRKWFEAGKGGQVELSIEFRDASYAKRAIEVPVRSGHFSLRENCNIRLYGDAHVDAARCWVPLDDSGATALYTSPAHVPLCYPSSLEWLPKIPNVGSPHTAWADLYDSIVEAQHFIYIVGWSVWAHLKMARDVPDGDPRARPLGEILKSKAEQGVTVLILIWDDTTSIDAPVLNVIFANTKEGLMGTHDEETLRFFKGSKVCCQAVQRYGAIWHREGSVSAASALVGRFVGANTVFTHHQKFVVCDAPALNPAEPRRRVIGFLGGLDLTDGRFDTPSHPLFRTLPNWHNGDVYQPLPFDPKVGPREPWHDIHGRVEGPAVRDIMTNFEQRWSKETHKSNVLVNLRALPILTIEEDVYDAEDAWCVQLFRSIDPCVASDISGIDSSIQEAYIHYIRRAEHFIYIENQYFLGSSPYWEGFHEKNWNVECRNLVPIELVTQIVDKIRKNQRFAVYVFIPMHPDGPPESAAVQAILFWQACTVRMMYARISAALVECGRTKEHPCDYLNFFCLGQREPAEKIPDPAGLSSRQQLIACNTRRHMIYIHSKMMIVDDEVIVFGSANINERSMAGNRDTETALGCTQRAFQKGADGALPRGAVSDFRLNLWGEHTATYDEVFLQPQSLECVQKMHELGDAGWRAYSGAELCTMPCHAMRYPYNVAKDGSVTARVECFPDCEEVGAKVMGARQSSVPNILTT